MISCNARVNFSSAASAHQFTQGLEGVLRDPGFGRNRARDSGIQKKPSRDS